MCWLVPGFHLCPCSTCPRRRRRSTTSMSWSRPCPPSGRQRGHRAYDRHMTSCAATALTTATASDDALADHGVVRQPPRRPVTAHGAADRDRDRRLRAGRRNAARPSRRVRPEPRRLLGQPIEFRHGLCLSEGGKDECRCRASVMTAVRRFLSMHCVGCRCCRCPACRRTCRRRVRSRPHPSHTQESGCLLHVQPARSVSRGSTRSRA